MGILAWVVLGFVVGLTARWLVPGEAPAGVLGDVVIGIAGALLGGWIYRLFGHTGGNGLPSIVCAGIGAVVLLFLMRALRGRTA